MKTNDLLFVVDGMDIINDLIDEHNEDLRRWQAECDSIKSRYFTKTSRVATDKAGTNIKEYTYWYYRRPGDSSIKSVGKARPDIESKFPPRPQNPIQCEYRPVNNRHIIIKREDFDNHYELIGPDFYVFPFTACLDC